MRNLDVPFFEHSITGLELVLPDGLNIDDYLEVSGYENARHNIEGLDLVSIDFQVKLIHGLIAAKSIHSDHAVQRCSSLSDSVLLDELSVNGPLGEAKAVGDLLVGTSISYEKGAVEWLGLDITEDFERSRYGPLGLSLYSGRLGIALFLAALAQRDVVNGNIYRQTAQSAFSDLQSLLVSNNAGDCRRWWRDQPLGFAGSGGILLALTHLKELLPD
jgi:lantibiotic modifying enzyme